MNDATSQGDASTWEDFEARDKTNLAALPDAVRAIVEECRAQSKPGSGNDDLAVDGQELPYPCRMYEAVPGEEELLQLQWMRIDMSNMDSERCWGEAPGCNQEYDCGPDSGVFLPAVYRLDPAQLFPLTYVGLPPELLRMQHGSDASKQRVPDEVPEDSLCKLGRDLTEALSTEPGRRQEGLPPDVVAGVASLADADWTACLERHVDLMRCDPATFAEVLSACAPPTLECLVATVLPSLLAGISSRETNASSSGKGSERGDEWGTVRSSRDAAAIRAICRFAASVALATQEEPVRFRERVSGSGLRKLGALGKEAEVALAEAFFYGAAGGGAM
ncbi:unnamed protein product [Laminaria digitata]